MTYPLDIFAPPDASRAASIDRRLTNLEGRFGYDKQRLRTKLSGGVSVPKSNAYTRLGLLPLHVVVPENARRVSFSGYVTFQITDAGSGSYVRYVQAAVMDVYRSDDLLYTPITGASVQATTTGTFTQGLVLGSLVQYEPEPGDHTYAIDLRSSVAGSPGTPATATLTAAAFSVDAG